jgi:hypothetical protein
MTRICEMAAKHTRVRRAEAVLSFRARSKACTNLYTNFPTCLESERDTQDSSVVFENASVNFHC